MQTGQFGNYNGGRDLLIKLIPTIFMVVLAIFMSVQKAHQLNITDASDQVRSDIVEAFNEEVKEYATYITYQKVAAEEGYPEAARFFGAMAESDNIQTTALYTILLKADPEFPYPESIDIDEVGTTEENLKKAREHEYYMSRDFYPTISSTAAEEGIADVYNGMLRCFKADTYQEMIFDETGDLTSSAIIVGNYYVCTNCGTITVKAPVLRCKSCSVFKWKLEKF
ncbi:MAG: hypothetical protein IJS35_04880 [Firmicutes bacterium]|nr:hypothetical protein [Bacillota bacterium]